MEAVLLCLTLRIDEAVSVGENSKLRLSAVADGFAIVHYHDGQSEKRHALQVEPEGADGYVHAVEVEDDVIVTLSRNQPNSGSQARILFEAPERIGIYRQGG